uniref:Uncharacterized protein n=1 Tax=Tanacetum cinerariifolium TaxID=118510 RepID=A0A6L2MHA4_TANCI|nr:hypothetical protein [Tanacetum cinerariifolium]
MDNKKHIVNLESFREMLHICPRLPHQPFVEPSFEEEILAFLCFLGHSGAIRKLTDVNINKLHQPWRSFAAIINKCLTGKSSGYDSLQLSQAQILDDHMFTTIKLVSRHQNTQQFGALLPIELTNEYIRNSNTYKEYYAVATGATPPKPKASVRKTRSSSDTTITPLTAAGGPRLTTSEKGKQAAKASKAKSLSALSELLREACSKHISLKQVVSVQMKELVLYHGFSMYPLMSLRKRSLRILLMKKEDEGDDEEDDENEGNGEENLGTNVGREEGHNKEDEADKLYRDININLGRGIQLGDVHMTQEAKDSHVTLTLVNPNGQQQSSSMSSQFLTSMLNLTLDAGMESIFKTTSQSDRLRDEAQADNDEFLKMIDENMQKIIKEQVKEQVKVQVSKILPKIEQTVNEQLEAEVLTRQQVYQRSNEQRNLYKALIEAYKSDEIILDTYGDTVTLKKHRDDDADKDEEPSAGSDRGSKRRREGKEPESAKEPMQTTFEMEEPLHPTFETGADGQPIIQSSQHLEWFSQQKKPPTPDRDWNKTLLATYESIQPWISELAKQSDSRSSFNELKDTLVDFSNFLMNRLRVDTLTPELLAGRRVIPFDHFINNDLEYLRGGASSRKYTTSVTKTKAADYGHIKWIEDLVPRTMWIQEPIGYDKHALWGIYHWGRKRQQFYGFAVNWEFARDVYSKHKIIDVTELKIKHRNPEAYGRPSARCRKLPEEAQPNKAGYNKDKHNWLMRIDELHKLNDGTLIDVRTALDDRLKGIRMKYLPRSIWRKSDKDRAAAMIQAIDKRLKTRRIMRSLERFVRGRLYDGDFRMLQRTI